MLKRLVEFASRINNPPPMYQKTPVRWVIDLSLAGDLIGVVPLTGDGSKGRDRGKEMLVPHIQRTTKIAAKLLADNAEYVLGAGNHPKTPERHKAFCDLVECCAEDTKEAAVKAVDTFLKNCQDKPALLPQDAEDGDVITFRVNKEFPVDLPSVRRFWADQTQNDSGNAQMQCLICGNKSKVEERLPLRIKGIPGGQASGTALISANSEAFESYGLRASLVGPTCRTCAEAFTNSINYMLATESYRLRVGPMAFVFWTKGESGFSPVSLLSNPGEEDVKMLLESYRTGKYSDAVVDPDAFYALSLSASGGRAVLRDWLDTTVPRVQANLARWFQLQRLVGSKGTPEKPFGIYALAASLYREPNDQMVANVPRTLVRCALQGGSLPDWLLAQAVNRNCAERAVTGNRIALIKTILLSQLNHYTEGYMEKVDLSCTSPGYLCGRLLAELEAAQKAAINPKATLVDRYYGAASSAPASVFGNLMRMNRAHMSTLNRDKPGIHVRIDQNMQEILSGLQEFPRTLNLKEQAMFALGYYHQKTAHYTKTEKPENTDEQEEK